MGSLSSALAKIQHNTAIMTPPAPVRQPRMNFYDLANLLDNDGNLQNEMMVASFAATMLATIPVLLGNEFDVNVGLKKRKKREEEGVEEAELPPSPLSAVYKVFLEFTLKETFKLI